MRKRKVNYKRHKTENTNRDVGLYTGKPLPFSVGFVTKENLAPKKKPRPISKEEWITLVKENEQKPRKRKNNLPSGGLL